MEGHKHSEEQQELIHLVNMLSDLKWMLGKCLPYSEISRN